MNRIVKQHQVKEIHVVLDNLSTHKPKRDMWLARHPNVHFHYTPTHTSWLNQIENWFSILSGQSLKGGSFRSVPALIAHIEAFIASYNEDARPFVWTKSVVHQKRMKPCFAVQRFWVLVPRIAKPPHAADQRSRWNPRYAGRVGRDSRYTDFGY